MILVCAGNPKKAQGIVMGDPYLKSWTVSLLLLMNSVCTGEKHKAQTKSFRYIWDDRTEYGSDRGNTSFKYGGSQRGCQQRLKHFD